MRLQITYLIGFCWALWGLAGCGSGDLPFNQFQCEVGVEERGLLGLEMEGEEEKLQGFVDVLKEEFGTPQVTFLHFNLETFDAFFDPSHRAIDPDYIVSPYGIQKILVWPGFCRADWSPDTLQMSMEIREHRMGKRPIDPYACRVEVRVRTVQGDDLLSTCKRAQPIRRHLQRLVERRIGAPHDTTPDPDLPARVADYEARKADYAERVGEFLDPTCYPAVLHSPWSNTFRLQLCEYDGMPDTLYAQVQVLSAAGDELPYLLYNYIEDTLAREIHILDGIVGFMLVFEDPREVDAIWFHFRDGRKIKYYEKGDYTRFPLPYKPRSSPEYFRRRRERQLQEELRPQEKVMS